MNRSAEPGGAALGRAVAVALLRSILQPRLEALTYPSGARARHLGCRARLALCAECRGRGACVICSDWSRIEPRPLLPVRRDLHRKPWRLQLPRDHFEAHALVLCSLQRGWKDDTDRRFSIVDVSLDFVERLPWARQA